MSDGAEPAAEYACPHCGQAVIVDTATVDRTWHCPACGGEFSLATEPNEPRRLDELDGLRIRQIAARRRADIRVRSYLVIAAVGCVAAAAQCLFGAWHASPPWRVIFIAAVIVALLGAMWFASKAAAISRELAKPILDEPKTQPDFSQLQDGSQMAKDLERL